MIMPRNGKSRSLKWKYFTPRTLAQLLLYDERLFHPDLNRCVLIQNFTIHIQFG